MNQENSRIKYADIIDLPRHQSTTRKHMSLYDRSAQFASYKALSGYEEMVTEEARLTDSEIELSESMIEIINNVIAEISATIENGGHPTVTVTYFKPDPHKNGGSYETMTGIVKRVDPVGKSLILYGSDNIEDKRVSPINILIERIMGLSIHQP